MKFNHILFAFISGVSLSAFAQWEGPSTECQAQVLEGEKNRQEELYTTCGFENENTAFYSWVPWAKENNAFHALYEISQKYPQNEQSEEILQLAIEGDNGPALIQQADRFYKAQNYPQAVAFYTKALNSPLLTQEEKGHITENIGLLYLNPKSSYYDAKKGLPLIKKAAEQRSALANNIMGAYSLFGIEGTPTDEKESFFSFWRAILLGCPVAQENLGLYHLLHQRKITKKEAFTEMQNQIFTCQSTQNTSFKNITEVNKEPQNLNCDCSQVNLRLQLIDKNAEYQFISPQEGQTLLKNKKGQTFNPKVGLVLPDGSTIKEVRKVAVILTKNGQQKQIYLNPSSECVRFCQMAKTFTTPEPQAPQKNIQAYHFSFTPQECSDILYYAEQLVDTNKPFVGKEECGYSGNLQLANQLLMQE